MPPFKLVTPFTPKGDQPQAIAKLSKGIIQGKKHQVLLGITGSGKTFTMANVIEQVQRPALIMAPNKALAAQLFSEFKELFPENAVEFFISYYDYYQPEAYLPTTDTYIEKDASINDDIDKMRHSATRSLLERKDVIIVASVSCIYALGSPESYQGMLILMENEKEIVRDDLLSRLVEIQYERNDFDFHRGTFRVRGDVVEIFPAYETDTAIRLEFFGDRIDLELKERYDYLISQNKLLEAQRIKERTNFDLEMLEETGYCHGVENYSRHLDGRMPGQPPYALLNYFPE
ncbi:MAG: DEAD/DEAH box helicase family protein, partial [Proteobacteria bacterium]|nr:DEAD/DEAH box helicase family protein [Pseudomonadota bacterium]